MDTGEKEKSTKELTTNVNRMHILNMMHKHWHQKFGRPSKNEFTYMADIACDIAQSIPADIEIKGSDQLTKEEILKSPQVQNAETTKDYGCPIYPIPMARKKPPVRGHNGSMLGVVIGLLGIAALFIMGYFGAF